MKFALLSDLHLLFDKPVGRLDNTHETQKGKLEYVLNWAQENEAVVLQAGDFFDTPRSWRLLPIYVEFFKYWFKKTDVAVFAIFGQHDTYMYHEDTRDRTLLGVLAKMGLVEILKKEGVSVCSPGESRNKTGENVNIYGASYGQEVPKLSKEADVNILVIHAPILKGKLWAGQENYDYAPAFLRKHKEYDLILCGDIHQKFIFRDGKRIICNTGCILRKSVDQWDHKPGFYEYDTETMKILWHEIPHEPPEKAMSREHLEKAEQRNEMLDNFIGALKNQDVEIGMSFKENLFDFMEKNKIGQDVKELLAEVMEGK